MTLVVLYKVSPMLSLGLKHSSMPQAMRGCHCSVERDSTALQAPAREAVPTDDISRPFLHVVPGIAGDMKEVPPQPVPDLRRAASGSKDCSIRSPAYSKLSQKEHQI